MNTSELDPQNTTANSVSNNEVDPPVSSLDSSSIANEFAVTEFLALLANDMEETPERLVPLTAEWAKNIKALVAGVDVGDINQPLSPDE